MHVVDCLHLGLKFDLTSVSSREFSSTWSAALPYWTHRGSRAPTPLMLQHGSFGRLHRRYSESGEITYVISMSCVLFLAEHNILPIANTILVAFL